MHLGNATAANTVTNFLGTSFMLCLLGGFIADTFLGRFVYNLNEIISLFAHVNSLLIIIVIFDSYRYLTIAIFAAIQATVRTLDVPFALLKTIAKIMKNHKYWLV